MSDCCTAQFRWARAIEFYTGGRRGSGMTAAASGIILLRLPDGFDGLSMIFLRVRVTVIISISVTS